MLYTGEQTLPFGDRLWAVPLAALWQARGLGGDRGAFTVPSDFDDPLDDHQLGAFER